MSVTTTCRDVSELSSVAQTAIRLLFQELYKAGIRDVFVTETYRSQARQKYLYAQGRTRPGLIVTWTLNSNHASRRAWDIAVAPPKNLYDVTTLARAGAIARKLGITWGGDWKGTPDRPHFEVKPSWTIPAGYKLEGQVIIPSNSKLRVQLIVEDKDDVQQVAGDNKKEGENRVWVEFSSPTLKNEFVKFMESKGQQEIAVKQGVDQGFSKSWETNEKATPGDKAALGLLGMVREKK